MAFGATHEMLAGLLLLPVGIFYFSLPQSLPIWAAFISGLLLIFFADLFGFLALQRVEASILQIIGQFRHIVVLIGAYFFFTEAITLMKLAAICFIILGIFVAIHEKTKFEISKGILYSFLSSLSIALGLLFIKMASVDVSPALSAPLGLLLAGFLLYLVILFQEKHPRNLLPTSHRKELFLTAGIFAVFELVFFIALVIGEASKVTPVTQSSMIFTIIGGYVFFNERSQMRQKIVGSVLIALGIILMYFI